MPALTLPTVSLMHPTLVAKPFHHEGWFYEEKYDGWRVVAHSDFKEIPHTRPVCSTTAVHMRPSGREDRTNKE